MAEAPTELHSVCVFCGSSMGNKPVFEETARELGKALADEGLRLVYGGGGVGLMGASARAAHEAGGQVLGIMPDFLRAKERLLDEVETVLRSAVIDNPVSQSVIIRADKRCDLGVAVAVMDLCNRVRVQYRISTAGDSD